MTETKCICAPKIGIECLWHYGLHRADAKKRIPRKRSARRGQAPVSNVRNPR